MAKVSVKLVDFKAQGFINKLFYLHMFGSDECMTLQCLPIYSIFLAFFFSIMFSLLALDQMFAKSQEDHIVAH